MKMRSVVPCLLLAAIFWAGTCPAPTVINPYRFASVSSPTNIANCELYLEAANITGLNDGDSVSSWVDTSGNTRHAVQWLSQAVPVYKTSIVNGKPVIRFNGSTQMMSNKYAISGASTVIAVAKKAAAGSGLQSLIQAAAPSTTYFNDIEARRTVDKWGTYQNSIKASSYDCNGWTVMVSVSDGRTSNPVTNLLYTGYSAVEIITDTTRFGGDAFTRKGIGADTSGSLSGFYNGDIYALGIWSRMFTSTEVTNTVAWFVAQLGL